MPELIWFVVPGLVAGGLALAITPLVPRLAIAIGAVDMPGERKIHKTPIPRLGGLSVVASIAVVLSVAGWLSAGRWQLPSHLAAGMALGVLPIFVISLVDDIRSASAWTKFLAHGIGATIAVSLGISLEPTVHLFGNPIHIGWLAGPLSVIWIVGVTNAFNIIDGLDGLSAGLALIAALSMAAVFATVGQPQMAGVTTVLAGALAGFLPYNRYPARLFLGDTGATAVGFCLATFALRGGSTLSSGFAALLPVFILGLPIADTLIAVARRSIRRLESRVGGVFVADRNHIHHRLLALGVGHRKAVLVLYAAGLVFATAALVSVFLNVREAALVIAALLLAGIIGVQRLGYDEFAFIRRGTILRMYEMPVVKRGFFVVFVDLVLAVVAAYLAVGLKTDVWSLAAARRPIFEIATSVAPVTVAVFSWFGLYRGSWRAAGLQDLTRVFVAVAVAIPLGAIVASLVFSSQIPLSSFGIYGAVILLLTASLRASYVILENTKLRSSHQGVPALIYGAGGRGVAAVRELFQTQSSGLRPIGFIDDDLGKRGRLVTGLPVVSTGREVNYALSVTGAQAILISSAKISADRVERTAEACRRMGASVFRLDVRFQRLPAITESESAVAASAGMPDLLDSENAAPPAAMEGLRVLSHSCPSCKAFTVHRSKARGPYERFRKFRTQKRLYRCEKCGWRGWLRPLEFGQALITERTQSLQVEYLDDAGKAADATPVRASV